jgi:hypothetical protein
MTVAELSIPQGWDEITPEWMTTALADHFPDAEVDGVTVALRDDGTNRRAAHITSRGCSARESFCPLIIRWSTRRSSTKITATS